MCPSPQTRNTSPSAPDPPSSSQIDVAITHTEHHKTTPTHKEILLDSTLFDTYITDLDHELNHPPNSHTPTPFPQLAHTLIIDSDEYSIYTTKSLVPSIKQTNTLTTNHTITFDSTHSWTSQNPRHHYHTRVSLWNWKEWSFAWYCTLWNIAWPCAWHFTNWKFAWHVHGT